MITAIKSDALAAKKVAGINLISSCQARVAPFNVVGKIGEARRGLSWSVSSSQGRGEMSKWLASSLDSFARSFQS